MLLYTGIYNPNSLPVKHYRFRLDFNFWRIIALAHIRMSLQYAQRQQQHREAAGARAAEPRGRGDPPQLLWCSRFQSTDTPKSLPRPAKNSNPQPGGAGRGVTVPKGPAPPLPAHRDGAAGFRGFSRLSRCCTSRGASKALALPSCPLAAKGTRYSLLSLE